MPIKRKTKKCVNTTRIVTMQVTTVYRDKEKYEGKLTPEQISKLAAAYKDILGADDVVIKEVRDFTNE